MSRNEHWNQVYGAKTSDQLSWFQPVPFASFTLLEAAGLNEASCVVDIGGGDSRLVDVLLDRGVTCITVLDVSSAALDRARARIGASAQHVKWVVADVTDAWVVQPVDIWHDRAVFHFLVDHADRARYLENLRGALRPGGHAIFATFASDGPTRCSGLPVMRYSPELLTAELGDDFSLLRSFGDAHETPMGTTQSFLFALFRRKG